MMIPMQISAKDGMDRIFQSTPAKDATATDARTLLTKATGDRVEGDEGDGEAGYGCSQPNQAASMENALAHGLKHNPALAEVQDA